MERQGESSIEFEKKRIISMEQQIRRTADKTLADAVTAGLKTGDALLFNVSGTDEMRDEMVILISVQLEKEKELVEAIVEMTASLSRFLIDSYRCEGWQQPDIIPTHFNMLGTHWEYLCNGYQSCTAPAERLASLSGYNSSTSRPMIQNSADLVKEACGLEITAITKNEWTLEGETHPDGMIGHVYDVLLAHRTKCLQESAGTMKSEKSISEEFKRQFRDRANALRKRANGLWTHANTLWKQAEDNTPAQAELTLGYLEEAAELLGKNDRSDSAQQLVTDAREFIEKLPELS